jgi:hypothetical protein
MMLMLMLMKKWQRTKRKYHTTIIIINYYHSATTTSTATTHRPRHRQIVTTYPPTPNSMSNLPADLRMAYVPDYYAFLNIDGVESKLQLESLYQRYCTLFQPELFNDVQHVETAKQLLLKIRVRSSCPLGLPRESVVVSDALRISTCIPTHLNHVAESYRCSRGCVVSHNVSGIQESIRDRRPT